MGASHGDVSFEHTEHTLWRKVSEYFSCIAFFLAEVCFVCSKEASHVYWWKIMESFRP